MKVCVRRSILSVTGLAPNNKNVLSDFVQELLGWNECQKYGGDSLRVATAPQRERPPHCPADHGPHDVNLQVRSLTLNF